MLAVELVKAQVVLLFAQMLVNLTLCLLTNLELRRAAALASLFVFECWAEPAPLAQNSVSRALAAEPRRQSYGFPQSPAWSDLLSETTEKRLSLGSPAADFDMAPLLAQFVHDY